MLFSSALNNDSNMNGNDEKQEEKLNLHLSPGDSRSFLINIKKNLL